MQIDIKVPGVGESVQEAVLAEWYKGDGDMVEKDEPLFVLETDKVTLEVPAEATGRLKITVAAGETVVIGAVVGAIETEAAAQTPETGPPPETAEAPVPEEGAPAPEEEEAKAPAPEKVPAEATPQTKPARAPEKPPSQKMPPAAETPRMGPSARRLVAEKHLDPGEIAGTGPDGRITKGDVILHLETRAPAQPSPEAGIPSAPTGKEAPPAETETRKPMSPIRQRIAERLLEAKQSTAMLTTFNEIDMSRVMALRSMYKEAFKEKHGVSLGFMSFFIKAVTQTLKEFPELNSRIEGKEIVTPDYRHIGVAVSTDRGLIVPVIRHADRLGFAMLEKAIVEFVKKVKENRLKVSDLEGGTFSITNGGVFGSLLSTPILNYPQSGILGMHKIEDRPVAEGGQVVVRPMMYVALSYDHRIVDGREAVRFLVRIKSHVENPEQMLMEI